jgi:hypothetical protein
MAETTAAAGGGRQSNDQYRPSSSRALQEIYSSATEIVRFEQILSEARTPSEYYREYKHLVLMLLRFASAIRPLSTQQVAWDEDKVMLGRIKQAVQADYVPPKPTIKTEVHAHSQPILYDLYVADFPMLTCDRGALPLMLAELKEAFIARETERGIARMGAAYLWVGELLAKYGKWDLDTKFRTTAEGWDPERRKRLVASERDLISMENTAGSSTRSSSDNDEDDDAEK